MNSKFRSLCTVLEQTVAQLEPGIEFTNLNKVYTSLENECSRRCNVSSDPVCGFKCKADSARKAFAQGGAMMSKLNQIQDPKQRERQQLKLKRQIERMKQKQLAAEQRLSVEMTKFSRVEGSANQPVVAPQ